VGEACRWKASLERKPAEAIRFYAAITVATLIGLLLNFIHIDPMKALFWAAILNGIVAAPLMAVIMAMASNRKGDGRASHPPLSQDPRLDCNCCHVLRVHWRHLDMEVAVETHAGDLLRRESPCRA
jgi:Mn2+/Fe2+ NRAMP family transporter